MTAALIDFPPPQANPRAAVTGGVQYIEPSAQKPYAAYTYEPGGASETNAVFTPYAVTIRNARLRESAASLDLQGFQLVRAANDVRDHDDERQLLSLGRAEAADLVKAVTGANTVLVFDHTVRRRTPDAPRQPSVRVHNDYTDASAPRRVRELLGAEAETLLRRRVAFINVWRPIRHPAHDRPLALCDARSVAPEDWIAQDVIYPERRGEIYGVRYNPAHRWFYYPAMTPDEAVLLKCYDSRADVARFTPHTSFIDPAAPVDAPPRESVEYRAIAFY